MNTQTRFSQSPLSLCFKFPNFPPFPSRLFVFHHNSQFWFLRNQSIFFFWRWLWKVREFHWRRFYSFCSFLPFSQPLSRIRFSTPRNQYLQALLLPLVPLLLFRLKEMYIHLGMLSYLHYCILWLVQQSSSKSLPNSLIFYSSPKLSRFFFSGLGFFFGKFWTCVVVLWYEPC